MNNDIFKYKWNSPERLAAAKSMGISNYTGTSAQNQILNGYKAKTPAQSAFTGSIQDFNQQMVKPNTYSMGNINVPKVDDTLKEFNKKIVGNSPSTTDTLFQGGLNLGYGQNMSLEEEAAMRAEAESVVNPYYEALGKYDNANFQNNDSNILNNYDVSTRDYQARAQQALEDLDNQEANNGTWASSERATRRQKLQDSQNRGFESLYNQNADNLYKNRLNQAYQYGDNAVANLPSLNRYGVQFKQNSPTFDFSQIKQGGNVGSNGFQGRVNVSRKNNINNRFLYKNMKDYSNNLFLSEDSKDPTK
jgi:hypothetical protein